MSSQETARIVIVGGGVIGLSIAYHLAKLGLDDVLLLERNRLTSGTSWHAAGIVGPLRATMNATRLAVQPALGPRHRRARHAARSRPGVRRSVGQAGRLHRPRRPARSARGRYRAPAAAVRSRRRASAPAARRARLSQRNPRRPHHVGRPGLPRRSLPLLRLGAVRAGRAARRFVRPQLRDRRRGRAFSAPRPGAFGVRSGRHPAAGLNGCGGTRGRSASHRSPAARPGEVHRWEVRP